MLKNILDAIRLHAGQERARGDHGKVKLWLWERPHGCLLVIDDRGSIKLSTASTDGRWSPADDIPLVAGSLAAADACGRWLGYYREPL